jgi:hypothetical protein
MRVDVLYKKIILAGGKDLPHKSQEGQKDTKGRRNIGERIQKRG